MNINYYEKKKLFCSTQKNLFRSSQMQASLQTREPTRGTDGPKFYGPKWVGLACFVIPNCHHATFYIESMSNQYRKSFKFIIKLSPHHFLY